VVGVVAGACVWASASEGARDSGGHEAGHLLQEGASAAQGSARDSHAGDDTPKRHAPIDAADLS